MLSIGKLAAGQERYYEQQVAQGLDDYYTGRGESPGRWLGAGARSLGLAGTVEDGELGRLMQGRDPHTDRVLRERDVEVAALDLTFSAPKSASVLFGIGSRELQRELVACHEEAVQAALAYLEETAVFVRRGKGGAVFEHAGGLVVAAFRHRMSRALDPQLHTHCIAANMAPAQDGRWTALHHPSLYRAALTGGYLYQAHLRALVHRRLGLEWGPARKGMAELAEVPQEVLDEFSRRRHEMRRAMEDGGLGLDSKARGQAAALATRERKQYGLETHTWQDEVRARAAEHGLDRQAWRHLIDHGRRRLRHGRPAVDDERELRRLLDTLAASEGLTEKQNTFSEREVLRALAQAAAQGARVDELRARAGRFAERADVLKTRAGELTTSDLVGVERRLIAAAQGRASEGVGRVEDEVLEQALAICERGLNQGQRQVVHATVSSGHGVQVIEALAGTGKTYSAGVLRYVYQRVGYEVIGVAPTGRAVRELAQEAGIPARTLASMTMALREGMRLPEGSVLIFDEAGMAGTRETAVLLEAAQRARAKVVAIGDPGQLHSVQAGGWMRAVGRKVGTLKLSEVMRQRDPQERRALGLLHEGKPQGWLDWASRDARVRIGDEREQLHRAISEWHDAIGSHGLRQAVLIARSNETRRVLNERAREVLRVEGRLGEEWRYGPVTVAVGERVICRRNDLRVDVDNGTRGTVRGAGVSGVVLETDGGVVRELPAAYVAEHVEHAYALTGHGMQGGTVEWAGVVAVPHELTRGWSYTALSRARGSTRLFVLSEGEGWQHHDEQQRDEIAPGEREEKPTAKELLERVARYMEIRDDEDLAIEQLPPLVAAGRAPDPELAQTTIAPPDERGVESLEQRSATAHATIETFAALLERLESLRAQLAVLSTNEVKRLESIERQELHLIGREEKLRDRADEIPPPQHLRPDLHAAERGHLEGEIAGVQTQLAGVRALRGRLERELGPLQEIRAERAGLHSTIAAAEAELDRLRSELVQRQLVDRPEWVRRVLGEAPAEEKPRREWERAVREVAGYRLDHGIDSMERPLGAPPTDSTARRAYDRCVAVLERAQGELQRAPVERGQSVFDPHLRSMLGSERAARLDQALHDARDRVCGLDDERLRDLASGGREALDQLDQTAAARALRLEREHVRHERCTRELEARATELERQAASLGWRQRHQRTAVKQAADAQRPHIDRHRSDSDRTELELERLRSVGRHPDQWLEQHAERAAIGLAAEAELQDRRERSIAEQAELARIDPPEYVRELIGPPPVSGVSFVRRWGGLADAIERHRLEHDVDVDRDGPLGPEPTRLPAADRHRYERSRDRLAAEIEIMLSDRGMPEDPRVHRVVEASREREVGLERELT